MDMKSDFNTNVVWVNILSNKVQECLLWTHIGFRVNWVWGGTNRHFIHVGPPGDQSFFSSLGLIAQF